MVDIKSVSNPLFLREENLRDVTELLFFAYQDFTGEADAILNLIGLGRVHHRVIYFVGKHPGISVSELLDLLQVTKQSLSRVLKTLVKEFYIKQEAGKEDRRRRHLFLMEKGRFLEARLSGSQFTLLSKAFEAAGQEAVEGFQRVLEEILLAETRAENKSDQAHLYSFSTGNRSGSKFS